MNIADLESLKQMLIDWTLEQGFQDVRITDTNLSEHAPRYQSWLSAGYHGDMGYLARNVDKRLHPERLVEETCRVIVARMDYLPADTQPLQVLEDPECGYISRYATGRDYHKVVRRRLARIADRLNEAVRPFDHRYRAFTDSAPVLEKALSVKAGHGWVGRNSLVLNEKAGSWFFLGEIYTNLPLPVDEPQQTDRCGACKACLNVCPTDAILDNRTIDARRCISYLTIENKGPIPETLRGAIGNRIYGCDDCQLYCPWNRDAPTTRETDFQPRPPLFDASLETLFSWSEDEFNRATEGTAMRRIGYEQWQRNIAVAMGNAPFSQAKVDALNARLPHVSPLVAEHIRWALDQLLSKNAER